MFSIILKVLIICVNIFTVALSSVFLIKARSSRLYMGVFRVSISSSILGVMSLFLNMDGLDHINIIFNVMLIVFWMSLYNLWFVKYNQISNKAYNVLITIAGLLSLLLDYLVIYSEIVLPKMLRIISQYHILSLLMVFFCVVKFYQFRKQNTNTELNIIPFLFLISLLSSITSMIVEGNLVLLFILISSLSYSLLTILYYNDFKGSFYY